MMTAPSSRHNILWHVVVTIFLFTLALSLTIPTHPVLLTRVFCQNDISTGSKLFGLFMSLYSLLQFFSNAILGKVSDVIQSRRRVLLVQCSASCLVFAMLTLVAYKGSLLSPTGNSDGKSVENEREQHIQQGIYSDSMYWLLWIIYIFSRLLNGVLGNIRMICMTLVGDLSSSTRFKSEIERSANFGMIGVSVGLAWSMGPALTGIASRYFSSLYFSFAAALVCDILCLIYASYFVWDIALPHGNNNGGNGNTASTKTNKMNHQQTITRLTSVIKEANPKRTFELLFYNGKVLCLVSLSMFLYGLGNTGFFSIWINYAQMRYSFTSFESGIFVTGTSIGYSICQGVIMKYIVKAKGETYTALLALAISSLGNFGLASSTQTWMVYACIPLSSFASMAAPLITSLACKQVDEVHQGSIQGALSSLSTLSAVLSPILLSYLFTTFTLTTTTETASFFIIDLKGAPFYFCSLVIFLSFIVLLLGTRYGDNEGRLE